MSSEINEKKLSQNHVYKKRKLVNVMALWMAGVAMLFGIFWLFWILWDVLSLGLQGISWQVFTEMTPPPMSSEGGLANAIVGSLLMVITAMLIATPVGILVGIYLCEFDKQGFLVSSTRFMNDIMLSAPSIILGLFVYSLLVKPFQGFSGWAGVAALTLIIIPVVARTTENMLQLVPNELREAAYALGAPKWKVTILISLQAAKSGIVTGAILALARVSGETAPLLFTALSNQFWNLEMSEPMASLPTTIFKFAMSPFESWQHLAWAGVLLMMIFVLLLNIIAKVLIKKKV